MSNVSKTLVVFYHDKCLDGKAAAVATIEKYHDWDKTGDNPFDNVITYPVNYSEDVKVYHDRLAEVSANDVLFVDFTPPAEVIEYLLKMVVPHGVYILDHHKTAYKDYMEVLAPRFGDSLRAVYDNDMSGAMMAARYYINFGTGDIVKGKNNDVGLFIKLVDIRDRWVLDDPELKADADALQAYAFMSGWVEGERDMIPDDETTRLMVNSGRVANQTRREIAKSILDKASRFDISSETNPSTTIVFGLVPEGLSSIFGEMAYSAPSKGINTLAVAISHDPFIKQTFVSLRSNPELDCSKVAKTFGGGGHKNASGCRIVGLTLEAALDEIAAVARGLDLLDK